MKRCPNCKGIMTYEGNTAFSHAERHKSPPPYSGASHAEYYQCLDCERKYVFHDGPVGIASCSSNETLPGEDARRLPSLEMQEIEWDLIRRLRETRKKI